MGAARATILREVTRLGEKERIGEANQKNQHRDDHEEE